MKKDIKVIFKADNDYQTDALFASSMFISYIEKLSDKFSDFTVFPTSNNLKKMNNKILYEVNVCFLNKIESEYSLIMPHISECVTMIKDKYKNVDIKVENFKENLVIIKAENQDLERLKEICLKVVENMHNTGINLWNKYYPAEEFESLIAGEQLFVAKEGNNIISFFALVSEDDSSSNFSWNYDNSMFLEKFAINVDFLHKGYAKKILNLILDMLREKKYDSLKLTVYDKNIPAISLYERVGFKKVEGSYTLTSAFDNSEKKMLGMEYKLN